MQNILQLWDPLPEPLIFYVGVNGQHKENFGSQKLPPVCWKKKKKQGYGEAAIFILKLIWKLAIWKLISISVQRRRQNQK